MLEALGLNTLKHITYMFLDFTSLLNYLSHANEKYGYASI
jgi:hypothetical protein